MPDGLWPGTGAVLAAIETATGRTADRIVGKPEAAMYEAALDRLGAGPHRSPSATGSTIDVAGARRAGLDSALVLTGGTTRARPTPPTRGPTHVADSLADARPR